MESPVSMLKETPNESQKEAKTTGDIRGDHHYCRIFANNVCTSLKMAIAYCSYLTRREQYAIMFQMVVENLIVGRA